MRERKCVCACVCVKREGKKERNKTSEREGVRRRAFQAANHREGEKREGLSSSTSLSPSLPRSLSKVPSGRGDEVREEEQEGVPSCWSP